MCYVQLVSSIEAAANRKPNFSPSPGLAQTGALPVSNRLKKGPFSTMMKAEVRTSKFVFRACADFATCLLLFLLISSLLKVRVNLGLMAMKGYPTFPISPKLEIHHQMQFIVITKTPSGGGMGIPLQGDTVSAF